MFVGEQHGKAEEAMTLYVSLFEDSRVMDVQRWGEDEPETGIKQARFELAGREFMAMDSGLAHAFTFTPATSLYVELEDAAQVDAAFAELSSGGQVLMPLQAYPFSPRFGWCNDRYGVSWQLVLVA
jgi:predicted 3-demethylubiquinone-9 3-methyltransferase (glyoxalase superfamily)